MSLRKTASFGTGKAFVEMTISPNGMVSLAVAIEDDDRTETNLIALSEMADGLEALARFLRELQGKYQEPQ